MEDFITFVNENLIKTDIESLRLSESDTDNFLEVFINHFERSFDLHVPDIVAYYYMYYYDAAKKEKFYKLLKLFSCLQHYLGERATVLNTISDISVDRVKRELDAKSKDIESLFIERESFKFMIEILDDFTYKKQIFLSDSPTIDKTTISYVFHRLMNCCYHYNILVFKKRDYRNWH